ncbi:hypothetical protein AB0D86_24555 [Streptomyces sp. NPDC048324]|uniref:hypothetical protein n=1 Tax=Streptomyces sp. NPDC048324 TaxID=3157205 RepID=UPI0034324838
MSAALELFEQHLKSPPWARRARNELRAAGVDVRLPQGGGRRAVPPALKAFAE